jgi:hypothetical protein
MMAARAVTTPADGPGETDDYFPDSLSQAFEGRKPRRSSMEWECERLNLRHVVTRWKCVNRRQGSRATKL